LIDSGLDVMDVESMNYKAHHLVQMFRNDEPELLPKVVFDKHPFKFAFSSDYVRDAVSNKLAETKGHRYVANVSDCLGEVGTYREGIFVNRMIHLIGRSPGTKLRFGLKQHRKDKTTTTLTFLQPLQEFRDISMMDNLDVMTLYVSSNKNAYPFDAFFVHHEQIRNKHTVVFLTFTVSTSNDKPHWRQLEYATQNIRATIGGRVPWSRARFVHVMPPSTFSRAKPWKSMYTSRLDRPRHEYQHQLWCIFNTNNDGKRYWDDDDDIKNPPKPDPLRFLNKAQSNQLVSDYDDDDDSDDDEDY